MRSIGTTQTAGSIDITRIISGIPVDRIQGDASLFITILDKIGAEWVLSFSSMVDQLDHILNT